MKKILLLILLLLQAQVFSQSAPFANGSQVYAGSATISNLTAIGTNLKWYDNLVGGLPLLSATTLTSGTTYYVSQTINSVESPRTAVTVTKISETTQNFCGFPTITTLISTPAAGFTAQWFLDASGGSVLPVAPLSPGIYYVEQKFTPTVSTVSGAISDPAGLAVQSDGKILIGDLVSNTVKRMNANGTGIETLGSGFLFPTGITIEPDGKILVADYAKTSIVRMNADGSNMQEIGFGFNAPHSVAVLPNGKIVVADAGNNAIKIMNSDGTNIQILASGFDYPTGVAIQSDGRILLLDTYNQAIKRINTDGSGIETVATFSSPTGLAVQLNGKIWVNDAGANAIKIMNNDGSGIETVASGNAYANGIAVEANGSILYADRSTPGFINRINGEPSVSNRVPVTINVFGPPPSPVFTNANTLNCSVFDVNLLVVQEPNITYSWDRRLNTASGAIVTNLGTGNQINVNVSGIYRCTATDATTGCTASYTSPVVVANYVFNGSITNTDTAQTGRMTRIGVPSSCTVAKTYPGTFAATGQRKFDSYTITNPRNVSVCATIGLKPNCGTNIFCAVYSNSFNPLDISSNYLGGFATSDPNDSFAEVNVPANSSIVIVVHEVTVGVGCNNYSLTANLPIETPAITVSPSASQCDGAPITLTASEADSYLWSPGGATTKSITHSAGSVNYVVGLRYGNTTGCSASIFSQVSTAAPTAAPIASATQSFNGNITLANLSATGIALKWYNVATGGTALISTTALTTGVYYVTQTINSCESIRVPVQVNSNIGEALNFDGVNDYVVRPLVINSIDNLSLEVKLKWNGSVGTPVRSQVILLNGNTSNSGYALYIKPNNNLSILCGGVAFVESTQSLTAGTWQHLAAVRQNGIWKLYLDGVSLPITNDTTTPNIPVGNTIIGTNSIPSETFNTSIEYFNGTLEEIRLWNRAVSQTEILNNMNLELSLGQTDLSAYYQFNQGVNGGNNSTINTLTDSSGNGNTGFLNNFALNGVTSNWVSPGGVIAGNTIPSNPAAPATQTFCSVSTIANLVATGTNIKWYNMATGGSALINSTPLTTGNYFATQNINLIESTRTSVAVTVNTTTWNGITWSNGLPDASKGAVISGNYSEAVNLSACSLEITGTAVVNVPSGFDFTIANEVNVASTASLTFENTSNLLQTSTATNTGNVNIKRTTPIQRLAYTMWSSPVANQNALAFSPLTVPTRFYTYAEANNTFVELATPSITNLFPGVGYAIRAPNTFPASSTAQFVGTFTGTPNNGDYNFAGSKVADGYNLIGNPYPSTILVDTFLITNQNVNTLYFWDNSNLGTAGNRYATRNSFTGTFSAVSTKTPTNFIAPGQGFYVQITSATNTNVVFNNSMRSSENTPVFFRNATSDKSLFKLNLLGVTNPFNQIAIGYLENATNGIDNQIDAIPFAQSPTMVSSLINNLDYVIQGRSLPFANTDAVPLGFKTDVAGNYSFTTEAFEGIFANNQNVFVKDNLVGITHNVKQSPYQFSTNAGTFNSRFEIVYQSNLGIENPNFNDNSVFVFQKDGAIHVNSGAIEMKNVTIFDLRGRKISEKNNVNATTTQFNLNVEQQVLLVKITSHDGQIVTKKIVN